MIGAKPIFTTPYHPAGNGRCERQHAVLKSILKKLCRLQPREWHRFIPCALFAMRKIPSDSLDFSPFELIYGSQVRGPLMILNELWTKDDVTEETQSVYSFLFDLRARLKETSKLIVDNLDIAMDKYKTYFDFKSTNQNFKAGDEVLILLPSSTNKLLIEWQGPYNVIEKANKVDYIIEVNGKPKKYHVNVLKAYVRRTNTVMFVADEDQEDSFTKICCSTLHVQCVEDEDDSVPSAEVSKNCALPDINPVVSSKEKCDLNSIIQEYSDVFSELPGCTSTVVHKIELTTEKPIRRKMYPVPVHLQEEVNKEVDKLYDLGIIEESNSNYTNPIVMVKKPDGG